MGKDDNVSTKPTVDEEYYIGSSDNPGVVITPVQLRGAINYDEWAKVVIRPLISKWKFGFVDGSIAEPTTDTKKMKHWMVVHSMLVSTCRGLQIRWRKIFVARLMTLISQ